LPDLAATEETAVLAAPVQVAREPAAKQSAAHTSTMSCRAARPSVILQLEELAQVEPALVAEVALAEPEAMEAALTAA
jgi:hypothetical protein